MIDISVEYEGGYVSITDGTIAVLHEHDGLGMTPGHGITTRGSMQHGETLVDYRLDPRVFALVLGIKAASLAAVEAKRLQLWRVLRWQATPLTLQFTTDASETRRIAALLSDGIAGGLGAGMRVYQRIGVQFIAHDPTFYDPVMGAQSFDLGGGTGFEIPMPVPTAIGASTIDQTHTITNSGSAPSYPFIRLTGPLEDPIITNVTTGKVLSFNGTHLAAGTYYDVDCRYEYQTVTDNTGTSQIAKLTDASDLGLFRLEPASYTIGGVNSINVVAAGVTTASSVYFNWYNRYLGL